MPPRLQQLTTTYKNFIHFTKFLFLNISPKEEIKHLALQRNFEYKDLLNDEILTKEEFYIKNRQA